MIATDGTSSRSTPEQRRILVVLVPRRSSVERAWPPGSRSADRGDRVAGRVAGHPAAGRVGRVAGASGGTLLLTGALGAVDVGIALSVAGAGLASGLVVASSGYATLALGGGVAALLMLPFLGVARRREILPN